MGDAIIHVAVIAGEFGASSQLNAPARTAWLSAVRKSCEQQAHPWALWGYDDSMGFALHPPDPRGYLDPDLLRALGSHWTVTQHCPIKRHPSRTCVSGSSNIRKEKAPG